MNYHKNSIPDDPNGSHFDIPPLEVHAEAVFDFNATPYRVVVLDDGIQWQRESGLGIFILNS